MNTRFGIAIVSMLLLLFSKSATATQSHVTLTPEQHKELIVFGMRAMGARVTPSDVKNPLTREKVEALVATGLNLNGHLCAEMVDLRPIQLKSKYEATCITYRGGSATTTYIIDALQGVAFEQ